MRKKFLILSLCCLILALAIFAWTYCLYHYMSPEGIFTTVLRYEPGKPMVTYLFGVWGVCFLFASIMSLLVGLIFGSKKK